MTRPTFNPEVSWGHILTGFTMLVTVISMYFGVNAKIAAMAYAQELGDKTLQQQATENTAAIERNIQAIKEFDIWADDHQGEWDRHIGAYGVEHE